MKIEISYNGKKYTLSFTRATAMNMAQNVAKLEKNNKDDNSSNVLDEAEALIKHSLKAEHPNLSSNELNNIVEYVLDNYPLTDKEENGVTEKGLTTYLAEMVTGCMPKGFTGKTTKKFVVIE